MLDFDSAVELLKKYGFSSTSVHPYIYQNGDSIGICYTYVDDEYGQLERIKIFETLEEYEDFLKQLRWLNTNAHYYHVRMILDNYEVMNPKVLFLRNEKIMMDGEMFDIETYDLRESQRSQMDEISQILYEAGDLLLVYDEIKDRQLQCFKRLIDLKNELRQKYFELQKEVDIYNKVKVERTLNLLPNVVDRGSINETMEITVKDRYNMYIAQRPTLEEITDFIREVWQLNMNLELNVKYYESQKEENDVRNELKVVDQKLELMRNLNDEYKSIFGIDLVSRFRKINADCKKESNFMSDSYVPDRLESINRKYAVYDSLNLLYTSDYLREAIQNTNYGDLAIKYAKGNKIENINIDKLPLNEVATDLFVKYRDNLTPDEQALLVLYNNHKYRELFNTILNIENFEQVSEKDLIKKVMAIKGFSKIKTECFDSVKKRIDDPINETVKKTLFSDVDFTTFETFIGSFVKQLTKLRDINNKMVLCSDINMYFLVDKIDNINNLKFVFVTNDLNALLVKAKESNSIVGIALLKGKVPVLYSPYYFDLGDIYTNGASLQMSIKEMVNFELLIDTADVLINIDLTNTNVARYYTEPKLSGNISYVDDIKMAYKNTFCKYSFISNLSLTSLDGSTSQQTVVAGSVANVAPTSQVSVPTQKVESAPVVNEVNNVNSGTNTNVAPVVTMPSVDKKVDQANSLVSTEKTATESKENVPLNKEETVNKNMAVNKEPVKLEEKKVAEPVKENTSASVESKPNEAPTKTNAVVPNAGQKPSEAPTKTTVVASKVEPKPSEAPTKTAVVASKVEPKLSEVPTKTTSVAPKVANSQQTTVSSTSQNVVKVPPSKVADSGQKVVMQKLPDGRVVKKVINNVPATTATKPVSQETKTLEKPKENGTLQPVKKVENTNNKESQQNPSNETQKKVVVMTSISKPINKTVVPLKKEGSSEMPKKPDNKNS